MSTSTHRQPAQETMMQTFATPAPITAVVAIPAGRIQFTAADRDSTTVEIRPADPAKGRDVKLAGQTTAAYSDGTLRITSPAGRRVLGSSGAVEVTVQLPAGSRVEATAASAQFTTAGQLGEVTFDSSQATVRVQEAATARLVTVDGDITVGRLGGDAELRTVRGDIAVTEATRGTVVLSTQAGAVTVGAAAGVSATLDAGTTLGRISNALQNAGGTPGLNIHATTTVGDITARSL
jgi:Putative adhesin